MDLHLNDDNRDDDDDFEDRHRTAVYDPTFVPSGGWDQWCEWAIGQGKIARIIQSRAKNAMCGRLISDDKTQQDALDAFARKMHLSTAMIQFYMDYEGYGRVFLEPFRSLDAFGRAKDLIRLDFIYPPSVRIFRDNANDVTELKEYLKSRKGVKQIAYGLTLKAGTGFNIIGYIQNYGAYGPSGMVTDPDGDGDPTVFFFPEELIYLARYPSPRWQDGLALTRQNYVVIMNKLGIERDQAIMARRHGDPKHKFVIPNNLWDKRDEIKRELKRGMRAGFDFFFRGRATAGDPDPMDVSIVAPSGNPMSVAKAQDHVEDEFVASMGFADSFTESGSSNRSVGEIQLDFFERDLAPERQRIAEILEDLLINPWLKSQGYEEGSAWFVFEDLSIDDKVKKSTLIAPLLPYLPASVLIRFLDNMGYPLTKAEIAAIQTPPAPTAPKAPADPQQPSAGQDPASARAAALIELIHSPAIQKLPNGSYENVMAPLIAHLAAQAGIPKPVLRSAAPAREQFKQEIEAMREDILDVLGL
ncbi:hypothetical protein [Methanoregula sp.]|uniref:phage portal protein family protein n=1 Tax=Methanoregula sp. TaxID=2052170 RepID=UPI0025ECF6E5|nr:hypothetical protein [Methanoregula sp.]